MLPNGDVAAASHTMTAAIALVACLLAPAASHGQTYTITTIAGSASSGYTGDGGAATSAQLANATGLAVDKAGNVYVADTGNQRIRQILPDGTISTVVGTGTGAYSGDGGKASSAAVSQPNGVAVDASGNLFIADTGNNVIRKVVSGGTISTVAGKNSSGAGFSGDGAAATSAQLNQPLGMAVDSSGNLFIADFGNNCVRKVTSSGTISTVAGDGTAGSFGDGGPATSARLNGPRSVAVDALGNLYIADSFNNRVRMVAPDGTISTVAGTSSAGYSGDLGLATKAQLNSPRSLAVDGAGNLYIADYTNDRIRKVAPNGAINTIAGNGRFGYTGDWGPAVNAMLRFPLGVAASQAGNVYISDTQNYVIRLLVPDPDTGLKPVIAAGGILNPQDFGGSTAVAPGSWVEIHGANLALGTRTWSGAFDGVNAPSLLGGTSVTMGGQPAVLSYVSETQVNAQVPSNVALGPQPVRVSTLSGSSEPVTITVRQVQPALLAPASFRIGGKQYVVAVFPDGVTFVLPVGAIPGIPSRPARPGETITVYGVGFGPVTPDTPAGQLVQQANTLVSPLQVYFGEKPATLSYSGLAPNAIGLYQFNIVTPDVAAGDVPLTFNLAGVSGTQTLYTAIQN
jgi:uncharacterized protein (TIGR03437 family)